MKSTLSTILISTVLFSLIESAPTGDEKRLQLKILKHQPCVSKPTSSEAIRFSNMDKAPLMPDPSRGDGCYSIQGPVQVKKRIRGTVQIYVEARSGIKSPVEKCTGADANNCGGFGSCVYCDICSGLKDVDKATSGLVHMDMGGRSMDCDSGVQVGNYTDIKISFCMPTKKEFIDNEGIDEDIWNDNSEGGHTFMMTMYIFNQPINKLSQSALQKIATDSSDQVIGCHKLIGSVSESTD